MCLIRDCDRPPAPDLLFCQPHVEEYVRLGPDGLEPWQVPLWDEINRYVEACGGDPGKRVYGNGARMDAVAEVNRIVREAGAFGTRRGIYMASKAKHGGEWKVLRAKGLPIVSTWIDECGAGETRDFGDLWWRNIREATRARVLIAYREPGEVMKGALVEIGAALAVGVPVLWVGDEDGYTVRAHAGVTVVTSIGEALRVAGSYLRGER